MTRPRVTHWLPQDPRESTITACGLDIDRPCPGGSRWDYPRWSRSRLPYGKVPGCPVCRRLAAVRLSGPEYHLQAKSPGKRMTP